MEQTETTATDSSQRQERSPELVRPVQGRMLAGVAQGVADNFGISEWIPRVFFIVTAFMGGLGIALYAAGWVFIRSEDEPDSIGERIFSGASTSRSWLGIGLMVVAGVIILSNFTFFRGEVVWALAFLVVGLLLYLGYIPTGDREGTTQSSESKEGVQRMTPEAEIRDEIAAERPTGDSPAGGASSPPPPPPRTPPDLSSAGPVERSILGRLTFGVMLLGLGTLALLDNIDTLQIEAGPRHYMALAVTILGVGLLVGSVVGRARWLILVGAIMVPTLIFSPVFDVDWREANARRTATPTTFAEVEPFYEVSVGLVAVDLRELPWQGQEVEIDADVDVGRIEIYLPEGVGIVGTAEVDIGHVQDPNRSSSGIGDPHLDWNSPGDQGTVLLNAEVNIGSIDVSR